MQSIDIRPTQTTYDLSAAVGGTSALVQIAPKLLPNAREEVEHDLREQLSEVSRLAAIMIGDSRALLNSPDEQQTDEYLLHGLYFTNLIAHRLEELLEKAREKFGNEPLFEEIGPILDKLADEFRDLEETFAMGLSAEFQEQIKDARRAALE
jgi:hypothetical protein